MAKRLICYIHDDITAELEEILKMDKVPYGAKRKIGKMIRMVAEAKDRGEAMEARMADYREAIEQLGFVRVK